MRIMEFMSIRCFHGGILLAAVCCAGAWAQQYNITTVAGTGSTPGFDDGNALLTALLNQPAGIALDSKGNLYIADFIARRSLKRAPMPDGSGEGWTWRFDPGLWTKLDRTGMFETPTSP